MSNKGKVIGVLKKHKEGLTIQDLANLSNLSRNTVTTILAELRGQGKIKMREIGMAKVHYWGDGS
ncbi:hypothetical protein ES703_35252 [subsurface metagenome]